MRLVFQECLAVAGAVISGNEPDPTQGACHYHTEAVAPAWSEGKKPAAHIGTHLFFNDID